MTRHQRIALFVIGLVLIGGIVWHYTREPGARNVLLSEASAVPLAGRRHSVRVLLKLANLGPPLRLVAASSSDAKSTTFVNQEAGTNLVIPGQSSVALAADGAHILLEGVSGDLKEGRLLTVALQLDPVGQVTTKARLSTSMAASHAAHGAMAGSADKMSMADMKNVHNVEEGEAAPRLALSAKRKPGGDGWMINLDVENFQFSKELADGDHVAGTGHGHIYLNGLKLGRLYRPAAEVGLLPAGDHVLRVTLNTNNHKAYAVDGVPVTATVTVRGGVAD